MKNVILVAFLVILAITANAQYSSLPIGLSMPMDKDTIEEKEPNFVWQTNLTTVQNDPRISQQIVVVKVESDQTTTEAILENQPLFIRQGLISNSITYSSNENKLEEGSTYAWQIGFLINGNMVQQSEVWQFTINQPRLPVTEFVSVRAKNDGQFMPVFDNRLNLLINEPQEVELKGLIESAKGEVFKVELQEVVNGELVSKEISEPTTQTRYFSVDLKKLKLKKGTYQFIWLAGNQRSYTLNFVIE
jgi:hypothetical protein